MAQHIIQTDVVVRDGSTVSMRRATRHDVEALLQFLRSLSLQSMYFRFMGFPTLTAARVDTLTAADGRSGAPLIVEAGSKIVGFAGFYRDADVPSRAEVAFAVSDALQGHG